MKIREDHYIIEKSYPFANSIKDKILDQINNFSFIRDMYNIDGGSSNVKAPQTSAIQDATNISSVKLLFKWILDLLPNHSNDNFRVENFWVVHYSREDFTVSHCHYPAQWSWVYFVNSPKGSSPLVFTTSGKRIKAEEGKVVIFSGDILHHVPKNKCNDRIVLAGNIFSHLDTSESVYFSK